MDALLRLPTELHHCILSYLTTNSDLKRVALTCKDLHAVALSHIYHDVSVDISRLNALVKSLHPRNSGLPYVRRIHINDEQREYNQMRHGASLARLIKSLPRDNLEFFELATTQPVSSEITSLLQSRQRLLKNHHLHPRTYGDVAEVSTDADDCRNVRSISLNIRSFQDSRRGAELIRKSASLTSLSIDLDYVDDRENSEVIGTDSAAISLKVLETLLVPADGELSIPRKPLKRLQLKRLDLSSAGELLPTLLDFSSLEELALVSCVQPSRLFAALQEIPLQLKSFSNERASDDDVDNHGHGTLNTLLQSFTGLQTLRISSDVCSSVYADCGWKAIERHGSTIRSMLIDDCNREEYPFTEFNFDRGMEAFDQLCSNCPQMTELAIRCPSFEGENWDRVGGFQAFLTCLKRLPSLTVLRLLAYPEEKRADSKEISAKQQKAAMQTLANTVFSTLNTECPQLAVVAVDARKQHQDCRSTRYVDRYAFIRRSSVPNAMRPVDLRRLKHHEAGCDAILHDAVWQC